jgi:hypothetical protein
MSKSDRKAYIKAVQCLRTLPSKSDRSWAPAAKTRFDDFVAIHVNQTMNIHGNGLFLTWHRYFVWAYEQALRNECGYKGYQPVSIEPPVDPWLIADLISTGTGLHIPITSTNHLSLTVVTRVSVEMASSLHTMEVWPVLGLSSFPLGREVDVSRAAPSRSEIATYSSCIIRLTKAQYASEHRPNLPRHAGLHRPGGGHYRLQPPLLTSGHQPLHPKEVVHHGKPTERYHWRGC